MKFVRKGVWRREKRVAPVRERGLKFVRKGVWRREKSRSREGAWIEIKRQPTH